jgi:putative ABC transport system permease protein
MMAKKPGFALVAIVTLALGIGATSAIFSMADAILFKSIPLPEASRLVMVLERRVEQQAGWIPVSPANFVDWTNQTRSYERLAAYGYSSANLTGAEGYPGAPERLASCQVTANFFQTLGVTPAFGRTFNASETQPGSDRVVILSHRYWVRRFAADPAMLGKTVQIDGRGMAVVGVMPASFDFPPAIELWMPLALPPAVWRMRPAPQLFAFARLKPGVAESQARAEMDSIARRLEQQFPQTNRGWRTTRDSVA